MDRHSSTAGRCKALSVVIVAGVLFVTGGKARVAMLPWTVGAVLLLTMVDAGQVALARTFTDAYNRFMRKLPLNGGNAMKAEEFSLPAPDLRLRDAGKVFAALGSFSVWPFYAALLALLVAFHVQNSPETGKRIPETGKSVHAAGCSSGGGCGTSGGCGSGGCGASSGKGCGCGSGAAKKPATATTATTVKTLQPGSTGAPTMTPMPQPANRPAQFPNPGMRLMTPGAQPGQAVPHLPSTGLPQQSGVRIPDASGKPVLQPPAQQPKAPLAPEPEGKPGNP